MRLFTVCLQLELTCPHLTARGTLGLPAPRALRFRSTGAKVRQEKPEVASNLGFLRSTDLLPPTIAWIA